MLMVCYVDMSLGGMMFEVGMLLMKVVEFEDDLLICGLFVGGVVVVMVYKGFYDMINEVYVVMEKWFVE